MIHLRKAFGPILCEISRYHDLALGDFFSYTHRIIVLHANGDATANASDSMYFHLLSRSSAVLCHRSASSSNLTQNLTHVRVMVIDTCRHMSNPEWFWDAHCLPVEEYHRLLAMDPIPRTWSFPIDSSSQPLGRYHCSSVGILLLPECRDDAPP